ncbi:ImmA/IrrE family metallo-endopeptidase [Rahnella aceris]|uniref:ImmA/IrrE family metallo-endopeptidase n=1 Tax=Rahnella sp. (strain Y9602) TaxID=2703885 RepID=UPI001C2710FC|nr:ImmA/IrrE family metallo-endopeptidase [Rahnella aceris]MBU9852849.1 ImmA/IrrE family metallo-endopeptidase [Rahnella aceris]
MYQMRGNRVAPMQEEEIAPIAFNFCNLLRITSKRKRKRYDDVFEKLTSYGIVLSVMEDDEWETLTLDLTIGHCDPSSLTISVPNRIYELACLGDEHALGVMFHELGHLLLGHKALLHFSNREARQTEDAEWQADYFAEIVLEAIGVRTIQMSLDFYM